MTNGEQAASQASDNKGRVDPEALRFLDVDLLGHLHLVGALRVSAPALRPRFRCSIPQSHNSFITSL